MQKRIGLVSSVALVLVLYLIWKDPKGTADLFAGFGSAVGGFFSELWKKLHEFATSLLGS